MSWEGYWQPHLLQATLFAGISAAVSAVVGTIVGLIVRWAWRKWGKPWIQGIAADILREQRASTAASDRAAAEAAASRAEAREAKNTALELKDAQGRIVEWLPEGDEAVEYLKETVSRLTAQLVIQAKRHPEDFESPDLPRFIVPAGIPGENGPATITGKHRLHTTMVPVATEDQDPWA